MIFKRAAAIHVEGEKGDLTNLHYLCAQENTFSIMNIEQKLVASVIGGLKALNGQEVPAAQVQLQKTKREFEGHLTLVVFPFLRISKKGPEQTAQELQLCRRVFNN